jgi:predicted 2-oxoglutarate/Fe(II)-dependent dioxygenase YbiX/peroxiredoxin
LLTTGDPAPYFTAAALEGNPAYAFDTVAGRAVLMLFFGSAGHQACAAALALVAANRAAFDDDNCCFFGVTIDPSDAAEQRIRPQLPGIRFFLDYDRNISRRYGAASDEADAYRPHWLVLDRMLRVAGRFALDQGEAAIAATKACTAPAPLLPDWAPVLMVSRVFDADLCRILIDYHATHGDEESGFMRDVGGKSRLMHDTRHKVRRDCLIRDEPLRRGLQRSIMGRLLPLVERAFQFKATRMERYLIGCYSAESGGHFRPHRDNTTRSTEHRRFAITINLNAEDYEGGELRFPEYGARTYRAPTGGAIVFSCGLLHEATRVTKGTRLAFLPFLYDEEAAAVRERNNRYLGEEIKPYEHAGPSPPAS